MHYRPACHRKGHVMDCAEFAELVSEFLDGALDVATEMRFVEHLADCADCETDLARMWETTRLIGALGTPEQPQLGAPARDRLLSEFRHWHHDTTTEHWLQVLRDASAWCPYAAQVLALNTLLDTVPESEWQRPVRYRWSNHAPDWTVGNLISRLSAVDSLLAQRLGLDPVLPGEAASAADPLIRTESVLAADTSPTPDLIRARWFAQAARICLTLPTIPPATIIDMPVPLPLPDTMARRAFETWVHAVDVADTSGAAAPTPQPRHLNAMAGLGVRMLPRAFGQRPGATVEVILSGPGGDRWTVALGPHPPARPDTRITMDVIDFCLLSGGRLDPGTISYAVEGDSALAREIIAAAPAFAES